MKIISKETCESTNSEAFRQYDLLAEKQRFVLICDEQSKGRGYGNNVWHSAPGKNLTCSLVFYPAFLRASRQFYFSMITALSIDDLLKSYSLKSVVKWPNDILMENKKIAGILIESVIQNEKIKTIVAGVGLNVNQENFSGEKEGKAISLKMAGINSSPDIVLGNLIDNMEFWYQKLQNEECETIKKTYLGRLTGYQTWKRYKSNRGIFKAKIIDICEDGKAKMETDKAKIHLFDIKEVELLKS
ncbi:MAG: biotin--[acetyl-CoA-carboxylase] ligase [Bacteroidales bacterium]